ncbi:hypothetical protein AAKU55_001361 [Oxalobacteraceae bacterium GrIS 1.11]
MTTDTQETPFARLIALDLISVTQRDMALAHPLYSEIVAEPDLVRNLLWMVLRNVLPEENLAEMADERLLARRQGEAFEDRKAILDEAMRCLVLLREKFNREAIELLYTEGLLGEAERDEALSHAPSDVAFASPAGALAWMVMCGLMPREQFDALRARVQAERMLENVADRLRIVEEAAKILKLEHRAHVAYFWRQVLPGSPWLWLAGLVLAIGGTAWNVLTPDAAPACASSDTTKSVDSMLFMARVSARSDILRGDRDALSGSPSLRDVKEVGYASAKRMRGCAATLELNGDKMPYAYTIAPSKGKEFTITGADRALVEARFSHIDQDGNFGNKAEPIGRDNVELAFRAGVKGLQPSGSDAVRERMLRNMRGLAGASHGAPEREREIAEVEPLGACRALKGGTQYACSLMIERNDPLLAAIGAGSSMILQGEFTFERDEGGQAWRVAPAFAEEFMHAVVKGRIEMLKEGAAPAASAPPQ